MRNLMKKEILLAMHPTAPAFLALAAMLLIPNYSYYVVFFYTTLAIFFTCLAGRENNDVFYSVGLPVSKREVVRARMLFAVGLEFTQVAVCIPFAVLRQSLPMAGNRAGMDANLAFFGLSFGLLGIFNFVFFTRYYQDVKQVGKAFIWACAAMFLYIAAAEGCVFVVPVFRDCLDVPDPGWLGLKIVVIVAGLLAYAILTFVAYRICAARFEAYDLE